MATRKSLTSLVCIAFATVMNSLKSKNLLVGDGFLVQTRTLNGKEVQALDVSRFKSIGKLTAAPEKIAKELAGILSTYANPPKGLSDAKAKKMKELFASYGKPTEFYIPKRISFKEGGFYMGEMFDKLVKEWNDNKGDADKTRDAFGINEWGEYNLPTSRVLSAVKSINDWHVEHDRTSPLYQAAESAVEMTPELALSLLQELD